MNEDTIKYEDLIRNSVLFTLDKDTQPSAYKREALKMVEYLYLYLMSINSNKYEDYGLEISQTANRCINNYSRENGEFINYFNAAMAKEYMRAFSKNIIANKHSGVHIPEQEKRIIIKFIKLSQRQGKFELTEEYIDKISEATDISKENIKEYVKYYRKSFNANGKRCDDDESDLLASISYIDKDINKFEDNDSAMKFAEHIDEVFKARQERQKPLLSILLTLKILTQFDCNENLIENFKSFEFFDNTFYANFVKTKRLPTVRKIAQEYNISEQSISRMYKNFISLL